uniref:DUF255 domain-containing protein n=1 Tax=Setaria digitata TaxID=48799 RepID=A0A915PGZ6_9BILA
MLQSIQSIVTGVFATPVAVVPHRKTAIASSIKRFISVTVSFMNKNRLANEKSPYLLQHANNPVHWYPWGKEAFDKAGKTNRLIFLSIGYSTCHWCHVMAHESFENEEIANFLNKNFVSIKVDREERPDVDKVYMAFIQGVVSFQKIYGRAGWPLSVFLTPDLKPITGGTYFPPHDGNGRPGFITLLNIVAEEWQTKGGEIADTAELFLSSMKRSLKAKRGMLPPFEEIEKMCYDYLKNTFDEQYKGFGSAPKFPLCVNLDFLLCFYCAHANNEAGKNALRMVGETLMAIDRGGIHDHIGKGFHRYSVDSRWHIPHFEKMLYDQAQLLTVYAVFHAISGEFAEVIDDIVNYVDTNLTHMCGGFYSAEDADSLPDFSSINKCEGAYYVWTEKEIDEILTSKTLGGIQGLTCAEDPRDELNSQNVLTVQDLHMCAAKYNLSTECVQNIISEAKALLQKAQKKRPRPHLDDKIITSWNGLMISGLAKAATALQNKELLLRAQRAVDFIMKYSMINSRLLRVAYVGANGEILRNDAPIYAYADDYAYFIQGLLDLYEASFDEQLIRLASDLQKQMDSLFWDTANNSGYYQTVEDPHIIIRIIDDQDGAEPSINSVASMNLIRLYGIINKRSYYERVQKIFENAAESLEKHPFVLTKMVSALQKHVVPIKKVIVAGSRSNETTGQMLSLISKHFDYQRILISLDPEVDLWLQSVNDHLKQLATSTNTPTTYICENFECSMPIKSVTELKNILNSKK